MQRNSIAQKHPVPSQNPNSWYANINASYTSTPLTKDRAKKYLTFSKKGRKKRALKTGFPDVVWRDRKMGRNHCCGRVWLKQ